MILATAMLLSATISLAADEARPDYSKDGLLFLLRDESVRPVDEFVRKITTHERGNYRFTWIPIAMPLNVDDGSGGSATFSPVPSALALLGISFPGSEPVPATQWLSWSEKRYRKKLVAQVKIANHSQNSGGE